MTCNVIRFPGFTAFVCSRGKTRQEKPVRYCCVACLRKGQKTRSDRRCDYVISAVCPDCNVEVTRSDEDRCCPTCGTDLRVVLCDKPLCADCAVRKGEDLDWCPDHEEGA